MLRLFGGLCLAMAPYATILTIKVNIAVERAPWISAPLNMCSINFVWEQIFEKIFTIYFSLIFKLEIYKQRKSVIWLSEVKENGRILFIK
jgi:hypothetical protein